MRTFILFCLAFFCSLISTAQSNLFTGTWQTQTFQRDDDPVSVTLQVAWPEKNLLYPAHLEIRVKNFTKSYNLLLAKKNARQLAISKAKYSVPHNSADSTGTMDFFNGTLDLSRDLKGLLNLHLIRLQTKQGDDKDIFQKKDIRFVKINDSAWVHDAAGRMLIPSLSPVYFGLTDTFTVNTKNGNYTVSDVRKNDIVSATLNGTTIIDLLSFTKKSYSDDIRLDTGMNILILFADNYADGNSGKAVMNLAFGKKKFKLDFNTGADSAAAFIAAKIYYAPANESEINFKAYPYPLYNKLQANDKIIGGISTTSRQVQLAVWDDAVEDGDSVSININDEWLARGFPVKKTPQFLTVTLKPGKNAINFIADNMGSIPPNTSILEIIDGTKRKSYSLETIPGENNILRIFYDSGDNIRKK